MPKKILVTGASGFIASHCIIDLLAHGYQVRGTVRNFDRVPQLRTMYAKHTDKADEIEFMKADLLSSAGWPEAAYGCDGLFHLASPVPSIQPRDANEVIRPAKEGALNALQAAKVNGIKRVVLTSSVAAIMYGHPNKVRKYTEQDWTDLSTPNLPAYIQSKTIAEKAAWDFAKRENIELTTINPGAVFGPSLASHYSSSLEILRDLFAGKFPLVPKVGFEIVDVRDVAILHRLAYESPDATGKRFLCTNGFRWMRDISLLLNEEFPQSKCPTIEMPSLLFRLSSIVLRSIELIKDDVDKVKTADISQAKALGWEPRAVEEAIISGARSLVEIGIA